MTAPQDALEGLLDVCDQIRRLREAHTVQPNEDCDQLRALTQEQVRRLRSDVFSSLPSLIGSESARDLSDPELLLLALLFHGRIIGQRQAVTGAEFVAWLTEAGFRTTSALALLAPQGQLVRGGWLRVERLAADAHFPLEANFQPSSQALALFWPDQGVQLFGPPAPELGLKPYESEEECFWDIYRWRNLSLRRAEELFDPERPESTGGPRFRQARAEARTALLNLRQRLAQTAGASEYAWERFRRQHRLGHDELLVVAHLLFAELVEGEPYLPALECVRVAAESRIDVFRKRRLIGSRGRLRRTDIVRSENEDLSKSLATEVFLADWATDELLGGLERPSRLSEGELDDFLQGR